MIGRNTCFFDWVELEEAEEASAQYAISSSSTQMLGISDYPPTDYLHNIAVHTPSQANNALVHPFVPNDVDDDGAVAIIRFPTE